MRSTAPAPPGARQLDLFDRPPTVVVLDPRVHIGDQSRVRALYRVDFAIPPSTHLVFDDRHGCYCSQHGRDCPAVDAVGRLATADRHE
jgi:hypothetical protein